MASFPKVAWTGDLEVDLRNLIDHQAMFSVFGKGLFCANISVKDNATETVVSAAGEANKVKFESFDTEGLSNHMTPQVSNHQLRADYDGIYFVIGSIGAESVAGGGDKYGYQLYKNDGADMVGGAHTHRNMAGGGGDTGSITIHGLAEMVTGDTLGIWLWNVDDSSNITLEDVSLTAIGIGT